LKEKNKECIVATTKGEETVGEVLLYQKCHPGMGPPDQASRGLPATKNSQKGEENYHTKHTTMRKKKDDRRRGDLGLRKRGGTGVTTAGGTNPEKEQEAKSGDGRSTKEFSTKRPVPRSP